MHAVLNGSEHFPLKKKRVPGAIPVVLSRGPPLLWSLPPTVFAAAGSDRRAFCEGRLITSSGAIDGLEGMNEPSSTSHPRLW